MSTNPKAYLVGGGIGSLAAAAFMIRDGKLPGENISILEEMPVMGGSLDGAGDPEGGYSLRGGRMLTTDNYECTWDLYRSIPSLNRGGKSVFEETVEFNEQHKPHSMARLVDPDVLYSLDATAHLARVSRRSILIYCRAGLVRPVFQPPYGVMVFTEEAIYTVRRIEDVRAAHGVGVPWIKSMFALVAEVERLRAEVRFYRNR